MNKIMLYLSCIAPLVVINSYFMGYKYYVLNDIHITLNVALIFLFISVLVVCAKLIFDFFVALIIHRIEHIRPNNSSILDIIICGLPVQWIVLLLGLLLSHVIFSLDEYVDFIISALAHTVYYSRISNSLHKFTLSKKFYYVCGTIALCCWCYSIYHLLIVL